jgi:nicotinate-nucleotide pyrophosphorylase (carboxylating)
MQLSKTLTAETVHRALAEDVGRGDLTTRWTVKRNERLRTLISAQAAGVVAGVPLVKEVYRQLDGRVKVTPLKHEGSQVRNHDPLVRLEGPAAAILTGERVALNFLGMLSGIATKTSHYVEAVRGTRTKIYDTRKTPPGLRLLCKYAVVMGGGVNHRFGLYDGILIKDNHINLAGSLSAAVSRAQIGSHRRFPIEVEAESLEQVKEALASGAEIILLDNLSLAELRQALKLIQGRALTEVSGGIDLKAAKTAAQLGVDRVSVGALTHSAPWLAMHLELE